MIDPDLNNLIDFVNTDNLLSLEKEDIPVVEWSCKDALGDTAMEKFESLYLKIKYITSAIFLPSTEEENRYYSKNVIIISTLDCGELVKTCLSYNENLLNFYNLGDTKFLCKLQDLLFLENKYIQDTIICFNMFDEWHYAKLKLNY